MDTVIKYGAYFLALELAVAAIFIGYLTYYCIKHRKQ